MVCLLCKRLRKWIYYARRFSIKCVLARVCSYFHRTCRFQLAGGCCACACILLMGCLIRGPFRYASFMQLHTNMYTPTHTQTHAVPRVQLFPRHTPLPISEQLLRARVHIAMSCWFAPHTGVINMHLHTHIVDGLFFTLRTGVLELMLSHITRLYHIWGHNRIYKLIFPFQVWPTCPHIVR